MSAVGSDGCTLVTIFQARCRRGGLLAAAVMTLFLVALGVSSSSAQEPLMVEKNLFSPERKPVESKPAETPTEAPKLPKGAIQLDGVFFHGDVKKAILRVNPSILKKPGKKPTDPFVTVSENEQVGDYRVAKIESRSITVEQRGTSFVVPLFAAGKVVPPAPKPPLAVPTQPQPGQVGAPPVPPARVPPPGQAPMAAGQQIQSPVQIMPSGEAEPAPGPAAVPNQPPMSGPVPADDDGDGEGDG